MWNLHFGHKLFSNKRGEIYVNVHNILNEKTSITRTQAESFVEDAEITVIDRYAILAFSYTIR